MSAPALPRIGHGEFAGTERFRLLRLIGTGGMGVVFEAFDAARDARVAVKTLKRFQPEALLGLKNEFRALQDLHHPNLVRLGELCEADGTWFFSMELVDGVDFFAWTRPADGATGEELEGDTRPLEAVTGPIAPPRPVTAAVMPPRVARFDEARLRRALVGVAAGLSALHERGMVHRDVKPSNILVEPSGRVVLLDFGLVRDVARGPRDQRVVGTSYFMAPEQALPDGEVGPAADWYAVGAMLYTVLVGRPPFAGLGDEALRLKRHMEPPPPSELVDGIPADLDRLCRALLARDAVARPDGAEVLQRLSGRATPPALREGARRFVGRIAELRALDLAHARARTEAVALLVEADPGLGKSALVRHFVDGLSGACLLSGKCRERELVPYRAVDGVMDSLAEILAALPPAEQAALLPAAAAELALAFPVLRRIPALAVAPPTSDSRDPQLARAALLAAVRALVARLASSRRVVICIDDLQWADTDGLAVLAALLQPPTPPLLFVGTIRSGAHGGLSAAELRARLPLPLRTLALGPLSRDEAMALAASLSSSPLDSASAAALVADAAGHPLLIDALVRHRLTQPGARGPLRLEEALRARIDGVGADARGLLQAVAVAGARLPQAAAAELLRRPLDDISRLTSELDAADLARARGDKATDAIEPSHDRVLQAALAGLSDEQQRALHRAVGEALESTGSGEPEALAHHFAVGGLAERSGHWATIGGDRSADALAFDRAAGLYRRALEQLAAGGSPGRLRPLRLKLARALANAGRGAEAAAQFLAAREGGDPALVRQLEREAADQLLRSGHLDEGLTVSRRVLASVKMRLRATPQAAIPSLLWHRARLFARGLDYQERTESQIAPDRRERMDVTWSAALGLVMVDTVRGAEFATRNLLLALDAGEPYRVARALALEAIVLSTEGVSRSVRVERILERARRAAERAGNPHGIAWTLGATGVADYFTGHFRRGRDACLRAEAMFRQRTVGTTFERNAVTMFALWTLWFNGELQELARRHAPAIAEAEARGDLLAATNLRAGPLTNVWLCADDVARARGEAERAAQEWSRQGFYLQHHYDVQGQGNIELYEGRAAEAYQRIARMWPTLERSLNLRIQMLRIVTVEMKARAALALSTARGGDERLLAEAEREAARVASEGTPFAVGLGQLISGGAAAVRHERRRAAWLLDGAVVSFAAADMALLQAVAERQRARLVGGNEGARAVDAAEARLRALGVRRPARLCAALAPGLPD